MPKQSPHDADEIAPGTVVDGRYRIVRSIGQGGNGMVYEVEHARTGRKLALKALLDETGFARLEQEARAASLMKNGHTAKIIDMEAGGPTGAYMVMELLEGQSLRALLDDAGQLPLELTANIAMQVCECLHEAHALGIIHRDLKPENVFLCPSPWPGQYDVKVLDFGVMKIAEGGGAIPKSSLTRTGSTVGTPYYMSLEQLRNSSAVDARADVYSLGVVLYECLSGRKPFQADTIGDLVYALCSGPPTQLARLRPDLPADMAEMVMRTLSANRDDRPASMLALATAMLPNANPAFALWVKVDGKQPALGRGPMPSIPLGSAPGAPPSGSARAASPTSPTAAARLPATTFAFDAVPEAAEEAPDPTAVLAVGGAPRAARGRRDTPTEMYVKGVHAGPEEGEGDPAATGDRDTPTRAIALDSLQRAQAAQDPAAPFPGAGRDSAPDLPTFDMRDAAKYMPPPVATGPVPIAPGAPLAKLTVRLGDFLRSAPPAAVPLPGEARELSPTMVDPGVAGPPQPRWQVALDRALVSVGRSSERQLLRFRAAPQNTQIIVLIVLGTIIILLLTFVLFLALH